MRTMQLTICCAVLILGVAWGGVASADPAGKENRLPPSLEKKVQSFQRAVKDAGYEVAQGYWTLWSADDCKYPLQTVGFCYGNNPTAPYVLAVVPPWKNEFVDPSLYHAITDVRHGTTPNYRLGEREALVVFAELPAPARYFGFGTNVFTRKGGLNESDPVYLRLMPVRDLQAILFAA
mgnify:FL=1